VDGVAQLSPQERGDLFRETAARKSISESIIQKDFWVCWTLMHLFTLSDRPRLLFKGGTSLSKVFAVIERFSEDIDLALDRRELGFSDDRDPRNAPSNRVRDSLLDELAKECGRQISEGLLPRLQEAFGNVIGAGTDPAVWELRIDPEDPQTLLFRYPASTATTEESGIAYIQPAVRLELGARSDHWPSAEHPIRPYAAEEFPEFFASPFCEVTTLAAERTFWEKATLLHREHHRGEHYEKANRFSRHYYDLVMLARSPIRSSALEALDLLREVAEWKAALFPQAWARYDLARPGTLRLLPNQPVEKVLRRDYRDMAAGMFFTEPPSFDQLLTELRVLEDEINSRA